MPPSSHRSRSRGTVDELPSGAFRVRVYAGSDPLPGTRHDLTEVVPPGPRAAAEAEKVRTRLLNQVDEQRNPGTRGTVNQRLDRCVAVVELEESTRKTSVGYLDVHVRPMLGALPLSKLNGEALDKFYAELRRCRAHSDRRRRGSGSPDQGRARVRRTLQYTRLPATGSLHRPPDPLDPLGRHGAGGAVGLDRHQPDGQRATPPPPAPRPSPPSGKEAARLLEEAWKDDAWGTRVRLAMTTGARRGELCALSGARHLDLEEAVLTI